MSVKCDILDAIVNELQKHNVGKSIQSDTLNKRWVFISVLNPEYVFSYLTVGGSVFHRDGPDLEKGPISPRVSSRWDA